MRIKENTMFRNEMKRVKGETMKEVVQDVNCRLVLNCDVRLR